MDTCVNVDGDVLDLATLPSVNGKNGVIGGGKATDDGDVAGYAELDVPAEWADFRVPCPCCDGRGNVTLAQEAAYRAFLKQPLRSDQRYLEQQAGDLEQLAQKADTAWQTWDAEAFESACNSMAEAKG